MFIISFVYEWPDRVAGVWVAGVWVAGVWVAE
jgi:hypothetical protein